MSRPQDADRKNPNRNRAGLRSEMSSADPWRRPIEQLGARLRTLHSALIEIARADYEREHGPVGGPQLLHLLLHDAGFAWLRALSMLMADIDSLLDRPSPIDSEDAAAVRLEL